VVGGGPSVCTKGLFLPSSAPFFSSFSLPFPIGGPPPPLIKVKLGPPRPPAPSSPCDASFPPPLGARHPFHEFKLFFFPRRDPFSSPRCSVLPPFGVEREVHASPTKGRGATPPPSPLPRFSRFFFSPFFFIFRRSQPRCVCFSVRDPWADLLVPLSLAGFPSPAVVRDFFTCVFFLSSTSSPGVALFSSPVILVRTKSPVRRVILFLFFSW